jgi:hypothetical protein
LNLPAFTFGGISDPLPDDLGQYVRGRRIVVLADNDREQQGIKHAQKKAERAAAAGAAAIKIVSFAEKDVSDFIAAGRSAEDLQQHCDAVEWNEGASSDSTTSDADSFTAADDATKEETASGEIDPTIFRLRPAAEITARPKLYGSQYVRKFISSTMARTSTGKTSLLMVEFLSMVSAKALLANAPKDPLGVWYLGEDPPDELERRITAACQHYGVGAADIGDRLHVDSMRSDGFKNLKFARQGLRGSTVIDTKALDVIAAGIERRKVDVLQLDPLIKFHTLNESDNTAMDLLMQALCDLAERTNVALEIGHHLRKPGFGGAGGPATMDDGRGASAIISAARTVRILNPMSSTEATKAAIPEGDRWRYVRQDTAPLGKANLSPPEATQWLQHTSEILPCGDSIGVFEAWKFPDPFDGVTTADMHQARVLARSGEYRADSQARNWFGKALASQLRLDVTDPAAKQKIKALIKTWLRTKALDIESRQDPDTRRKFDFVIPGPWADSERAENVVRGPWNDADDTQEF